MRFVVASPARHQALVDEYVDRSPTASFHGATVDGVVTAASWDTHSWTTPIPVAGQPALSTAVMNMRVHMRAGLRVSASQLPVAVGTTLVQSLGVGPLRLLVPVRVVRVVDEPTRSGFAYVTLPDHPEQGEEAFVVETTPDGTSRFRVTAISRPGSALVRLSGPLGGVAQSLAVRRYLRVAERIAATAH